jgi:TP901 family phage tail tape measure protein
MAGNAGAIRANSAYVEIFANDNKFQQSMTRVRTTMATVGQQMKRAGTGMFLSGASIAAPLMLAVRGAANFENALFDAKASAGLTAAEVDKIRAKSLELSKAGMGGPAAIAQAFTALVKAGMPLEQAMGGAAEAVIQFASNAGIDVTQAAETASDAMNVFGVSSTQATDILKAAADSSSTSVESMVQAFSQSSAVAGMANQSMQTLAASLAILANNGVKGSDAGTSFKTMLLRLTAPTDEAASKLREVGLSADSFRGADGKMLPMADALDILGTALSGLSEGQRDQALLKIFGTDAIRAGTILLKAGSAGLASMNTAMAASGTNADAYRTKMAGITGAMQTVSAATERLQVTLATALGPAFQSASQSVAGFMDYVGRLATDFPGLVTTAAGVSVGLLGIGAAAIAIGSALQGLSTIIGVLQKALALLSSGPAMFAALSNPAVLGGLAVAAVAIGGIGLALRALWPDFKRTTDEYLKMIGVISGGAADRGGKPLEARDIAPKLGAQGQARLQGIVDQKKTAIGADLNVPAAFRRVVLDEAERVKANEILPKAERDRRVFELMQIAGELQSQMNSEAAAAKSAKEAAAAAEQTATSAKERAESGRELTDEQQKQIDRIREENQTPQQKLEAEKARLMSLTSDAGNGLSQAELDAATKRAEEQAQQEIDAANKKANEERDRLTEQAQAVREQVATPEEKLAARIEELKKLPLDAETMARAVDQAKADAVDSLTSAAQADRQGISSAGTFGDATMLGVGPELSDPMAETAANTRRMVDELAALNMANGGPANVVGPPVANLAGPIGAEVAAPRAADLQQRIDGGAEAATATATLTASVQTMQQQMVAAIDRTTAAVESTVAVLKEIAGNTAEMGGVFV